MSPTPAVLVISSQVSAGPVGASVAGPALLSLGVVPIIVPTVLLSNHPGHIRPEGLSMPAGTIRAMLARLLEFGFLADCKCVLTGYFADEEQVAATADFIATLRERMPELYMLCDPVMGDDDALYVKQEIAEAIRDRLVPLANGLTPNYFEAGWLSRTLVHNPADAAIAAHSWPDKDVIITSIPDGPERLATALFSHGTRHMVSRPRLSRAPHGTGDLLGGLIAGYLAKGMQIGDSLDAIVDRLDRAIAASQESDSLDLALGLKE